MQSSSPTFSTPSTVTVTIFSCKFIKKNNSNICTIYCHRQEHRTKHSPQQAEKNPPKEAQEKHQLLNYQTWKFTVWKKKMNVSKSASWWPKRLKDLIHFSQIHNFCEWLSCDWSFLSSIPHKVMQDSTAAIQSEDST